MTMAVEREAEQWPWGTRTRSSRRSSPPPTRGASTVLVNMNRGAMPGDLEQVHRFGNKVLRAVPYRLGSMIDRRVAVILRSCPDVWPRAPRPPNRLPAVARKCVRRRRWLPTT
jgi:hypothetical protein